MIADVLAVVAGFAVVGAAWGLGGWADRRRRDRRIGQAFQQMNAAAAALPGGKVIIQSEDYVPGVSGWRAAHSYPDDER